ncbi:MAG: hypothetical protein EPO68_02980 [Planctomycetota bacterium]|nr:MAG: hypothetical protein EPO68_02980 [Planctomycetota bacterium]
MQKPAIVALWIGTAWLASCRAAPRAVALAPAPSPESPRQAGWAAVRGRLVRASDGVGVDGTVRSEFCAAGGVKTGADGRFRAMVSTGPLLDPALPIPLQLSAEACAYRIVYVDMVAGRDVDLGDIALEPGWTLCITAVDATGEPIEGAELFLENGRGEPPADALHRGPPDDAVRHQVFTGPEGRLRFDAIQTGPKRAYLCAPGTLWAWSDVVEFQLGRSTDFGTLVLAPRPRGEPALFGAAIPWRGEP